MSASEPTWPQVLERSIRWWIIGGIVFLAGMFAASRLLGMVAGDDLESWAMMPAAVLHYGLISAVLLVAHLFFLISTVGLAVFLRQRISDNKLNVGLSVFGLSVSLVVLLPFYYFLSFK